MGICRHCGYPSVLREVKFCPQCGKPFPVALDDPATWQATKKTGACRICGYRPVAFEAPTCPACGGKHPNPDTASRFTGRGSLIGFLIGGLSGAVLGLIFDGNIGGGFPFLTGSVFIGSIFGIGVGFVVGALVGGVISGMRGE